MTSSEGSRSALTAELFCDGVREGMIDPSSLFKDVTKQYGGYVYCGTIGGLFGNYLGFWDIATIIPVPGIVNFAYLYILTNSIVLYGQSVRFKRSQVAAEKTCHFCGGAMKIAKYECVECGKESG